MHRKFPPEAGLPPADNPMRFATGT